jgi:hypothetical protein
MNADNLDAAVLSDVVVPLPVVTWTAVVQADNPTRPATIGRLRELRGKDRVTPGVSVPLRGTGKRGLAGRATYYSVLSVLAAKSRQEDRPEAAAALVEAASELEKRFAAQLTEYLGDQPLAALPEADFFYDLAEATAVHVSAWTEDTSSLLAAAEVGEVTGDLVELDGSSLRGDPVGLGLPRAVVDSQSLDQGDLVWLFSRVAGNAAVTDLLPALKVGLQRAGQKLRSVSSFVAAHSDAERQAADRFFAGVGAKFSEADYARLDAYARQLPRRKLRLA